MILETLTSNPIRAVLCSGVTAVIQSSSATTVMVVGFVNSNHEAVLKGCGNHHANICTTVTSWILSLTGIQSDNFIIRLCRCQSFSPILALIGAVLTSVSTKPEESIVGAIFVGFAILMYGMNAMSGAWNLLQRYRSYRMLATIPSFRSCTGAVLTAIIQSFASVGILQALCLTGMVPFSAALFIDWRTEYTVPVSLRSFQPSEPVKTQNVRLRSICISIDLNHAVHGSILCDKCSSTFFHLWHRQHLAGIADPAQCLQYHGNSVLLPFERRSGEACLSYYPRQEGREEKVADPDFTIRKAVFWEETCICS